MPGKGEEADKLMKQAKKATTKSITKWSVSRDDWNEGADAYEKAAKIYTHEDNIDKARMAWKGASECHDKAGNGFFAAKSLENLARTLAEVEGPKAEMCKEEAAQYYLEAGKLFMLNNQPDKQAEAMVKSAKLAPKAKVQEASQMITDAIEQLEEQDKYHHTLDMYRALLLMQVRGEMWQGAIETLKRQNKALKALDQAQSAARTPLEIVVISLYLGDFVLAEREFQAATQTAYGFPHSREQQAAYDLIAAVEDRDEERLADARKNQILTFITSDISRMAKKIRLDGMKGMKEKKQSVPDAAAQQQGAIVGAGPSTTTGGGDDSDADSEDAK